jgi:hypothetical protein
MLVGGLAGQDAIAHRFSFKVPVSEAPVLTPLLAEAAT